MEEAVNQAMKDRFVKAYERHTDSKLNVRDRCAQFAAMIEYSASSVKSVCYGNRLVQFAQMAQIATLEGKSILTLWVEVAAILSEHVDRQGFVPAPGTKQGGAVEPYLASGMLRRAKKKPPRSREE